MYLYCPITFHAKKYYLRRSVNVFCIFEFIEFVFFFLIHGGCRYNSTTKKYVANMLLDLKCCLLAFIERLQAAQPALFKKRNVHVRAKIV